MKTGERSINKNNENAMSKHLITYRPSDKYDINYSCIGYDNSFLSENHTIIFGFQN
ncbi:hypothetical protein MS5214_07480 [Klebsiella pneumoniae]|nr:hypothetical protein MS5214_07480 [Klebsiella pneumoniae]